MAFSISNYADRSANAIGRLLSSFSHVLITLLIYVLFCFVTYGALKCTVSPEQQPFFLTFEIATGGDPYNFKQLAALHPVLWHWILFLHVCSWLMVPILAATAIDAAYRKWEERMRALDSELQGEMSRVLETYAHLTKEEADRIARDFLPNARRKLAEKAENR